MGETCSAGQGAKKSIDESEGRICSVGQGARKSFDKSASSLPNTNIPNKAIRMNPLKVERMLSASSQCSEVKLRNPLKIERMLSASSQCSEVKLLSRDSLSDIMKSNISLLRPPCSVSPSNMTRLNPKKRQSTRYSEISVGDIMKTNKNLRFTPLSLTDNIIYSEQSMSSFHWEDNGGDGLKATGAKTREQIGMTQLKAMDACGADVKFFSTHGGLTALMFAVLSKDFDYVKRLVAAGAKVQEENDRGETALQLAKSLPSLDIYKFLLQSLAHQTSMRDSYVE